MNKTKSPQMGRAADYLVTQIESKILSNKIQNGEKLPSERDLMNQYSVSRTVVREAISLLSSRGLVITKPKYRPVVRKPSVDSALDSISGVVQHLLSQPNGVKNLFDTRIMIEAMLVREAAKDASKEDIKALRVALQSNYEAINDLERFYATDVAFHGILYAIPKNPIFPSLQKAYVNWLKNHWNKMIVIPNRNELNYYAHKRIFEAILNRDPDEAEKELKEHLSIGWKDIVKTFE